MPRKRDYYPVTNSRPDDAGASTPAKAASSATHATAGALPEGEKPNVGAPTSTQSQSQSTQSGSAPEPLSEDQRLEVPYCIWDAWTATRNLKAKEILYLRGPAQIKTAKHVLDLDVGCWLLVRFPVSGQPMDGTMSILFDIPVRA